MEWFIALCVGTLVIALACLRYNLRRERQWREIVRRNKL